MSADHRQSAEGPPKRDNARGQPGIVDTADTSNNTLHANEGQQSAGARGMAHYAKLTGVRVESTDRPFVVIVPKRNGEMMSWCSYLTREESTAVAARLQEIGCAAWVKDIRDEAPR